MDPISFYGDLFFGGVLVALGVMLRRKAVSDARHAKESETWKTVDGDVIELVVQHHSNRGTSSSGGSSYSPQIRYMYSHEGTWITGDRLSFSSTLNRTKQDAEDTLARYAHGRSVPVRISPDDPEVSVLEPGAAPSQWTSAFAGAMIAAGAGVMALAMFDLTGVETTMVDAAQFLLGVVLFVAGIMLARYCYRHGVSPGASWPVVQGRITHSEVREVVYRDEATDSKQTTFRPLVGYTYQREGRTFTRQAVKFDTGGGRATDRDQCEEIVSRFRPDAPVDVFVSPWDRDEGLLEPEPPPTGMFAVFALAVLSLIGALIALDVFVDFF